MDTKKKLWQSFSYFLITSTPYVLVPPSTDTSTLSMPLPPPDAAYPLIFTCTQYARIKIWVNYQMDKTCKEKERGKNHQKEHMPKFESSGG